VVGLVERLGQLDGSRLRKLSTIAAASGTQNRPQASAMDSSSCMNRVAVERSVSSTRRPPAQVYGGVNGHPTRVWHAQDLETTQTYLQSARGSFGQWAGSGASLALNWPLRSMMIDPPKFAQNVAGPVVNTTATLR